MAADLYHRSVEIILSNQAPSGAYIASPNFPTYRYSWFRDGSFIAYAMNLVGEHGSAGHFHDWAARAVNARADVVRRAVAKAERGEPLSGEDILHTRYALDGAEASDGDWPNFQLDGFGTWLWALAEHQSLGGFPMPEAWSRAADRVAAYLSALWQMPCFDCWEEFPDKIHPHTLAAIFGGLSAHSRLAGVGHRATLDAIRSFLLERAVSAGHFAKFVGSTRVDASLLGLAIPYGVVAPNDPLMRATVECIESRLRRSGGVHRYSADTYYGGGEWILLACWLGWYYARAGEEDRARAVLRWVDSQANQNLELAEQVPTHLLAPERQAEWVARWGPVAKPLLWSHAKYLILRHALGTPAR